MIKNLIKLVEMNVIEIDIPQGKVARGEARRLRSVNYFNYKNTLKHENSFYQIFF